MKKGVVAVVRRTFLSSSLPVRTMPKLASPWASGDAIDQEERGLKGSQRRDGRRGTVREMGGGGKGGDERLGRRKVRREAAKRRGGGGGGGMEGREEQQLLDRLAKEGR